MPKPKLHVVNGKGKKKSAWGPLLYALGGIGLGVAGTIVISRALASRRGNPEPQALPMPPQAPMQPMYVVPNPAPVAAYPGAPAPTPAPASDGDAMSHEDLRKWEEDLSEKEENLERRLRQYRLIS